MTDTMMFPKSLDEFMEQYKILDTQQVYTNGTALVPIFRIKQWEDAHQQKTGKKFIEIVAEYLDPEICIYHEYKGRPYFSIRYEENGEKYEGFGTYNLEVLSEYLKEYFLPSVQPERKKGKWIDRGDYCVCSQCWHIEQQFNGVEAIPWHTPFCAGCGADMREETSDVVKVVRCKDCKFWDITSPMATVIPVPCRCTRRREAFAVTENDYCSYGERREQG